jgi:hypothetical protein
VAATETHRAPATNPTGEQLGTIWRSSDCTWSAADPDGAFLTAGLRGTRHEIGLWLQHHCGESANQNGIHP